ncbi:hypothetical protein RFI_29265, partial [Reticulomyxa filosa]
MYLFYKHIDLIIDYNEGTNTFQFHKISPFDDILSFNEYSCLCISNSILFFGGSKNCIDSKKIISNNKTKLEIWSNKGQNEQIKKYHQQEKLLHVKENNINNLDFTKHKAVLLQLQNKQQCPKTKLFDYTINYFQENLQLFINMFGFIHSFNVILYNWLGFIYNDRQEYSKAIECFEMALKISLDIFGINHIWVDNINVYLA